MYFLCKQIAMSIEMGELQNFTGIPGLHNIRSFNQWEERIIRAEFCPLPLMAVTVGT